MPRKDQYILDRPTGRPLRARDGLIVIAVAVVLLVAAKGQSIRNQGNKMDAGIERSLVARRRQARGLDRRPGRRRRRRQPLHRLTVARPVAQRARQL